MRSGNAPAARRATKGGGERGHPTPGAPHASPEAKGEHGDARPSQSGVEFARAVHRLVRRIPRGRVVTYGQIAAMLGRPRGARAVGYAMSVCPSDMPWHRVVNAAGRISRRARMDGMVTQRILLEREGVLSRGGRVALRKFRWIP
ncbi:MAG: MGMT family protein [Candidatus Rokubacteria bacterium]|nr:MGMT family protein [Candidatus Rokubacteria bacterium]